MGLDGVNGRDKRRLPAIIWQVNFLDDSAIQRSN